jgi:flavin reductase (DIM6/NTAB) family NADH-FMN oxidoreductase RutF
MEQQLFRDIMAGFPSGVTVVTALGEQGEPLGLTVSAFASASLTPALVLVCIEESANTLPAIQARQGFSVNFLAAGQVAIALHFASKSVERFVGISWSPPQTEYGGPLLDDVSAAQIECRVVQEVEAGDHLVIVGEVLRGWLDPDAHPLLHWNRGYHGLGEPVPD